MLQRPSPRGAKIAALPAAVFLLLSPALWAADESQLAPATAEKPWIIPPRVGGMETKSRWERGSYGAENRDAIPIDESHAYNLAELIDLAQRNNPETRDAWEQARQAAIAVGLVESSYAPQISIDVIGGFQRTPLPIPTSLIPKGYFTSDTRELIPSLALKWLLFDFGRRAGEKQAARATSFVANVAFTGAHQKLIFNVSRAYFALGGARGRLKAALEALRTAETVQDAAESRREHGLGTVVMVAQAQRQTAQARFSLAKATGDERTAYANLIASLGVPANMRIGVADSSEQQLPTVPTEDIDALLRDALTNRPDVIAAVGKIEAAEGALKSSQAAYYPTISVTGQLYQNVGGLSTDGSPYYNVNKPGGNILLVLSVPLYDGGARDSRASIAQSQVTDARDKLDQVRDAAIQQVVTAYNDLKTSVAAYSAALALRTAAQTAYDASFDAYHHGVGTYTDLANEETALASADAEREDAHANVFTAAAALAFVTGAAQAR